MVSLGGDIESAYRMVLALRESVEDIEVLVPYYAKSAATFFCLAADSIHMGRYGELGPLDPQRFDRTGSDRPVSSLESFKSLEHLLEYSLESLNGIIELLQNIAPMDIPYAIDRSHRLFAAIVSPLYSQVDPHELGESGRSLSVSQAYAIRVMERWGYTDRTENERIQIANLLILDYPTHGFVIDLHEAQAIGLNAEPMEAVSDAICRAIVTNEEYEGTIGFPQEVGEGCSSNSSDIESYDEE